MTGRRATVGSKTAKSVRGRRGEAALLAGSDPFEWALRSWQRERDKQVKWEKAMALLPYIKPKMRSVSVAQDMPVRVVIEIGGDE